MKMDGKVSEIETEVEDIKKVIETTEIEMKSSNSEKVEEDNFQLKMVKSEKIPHTMKELEVKEKDK